MQAAGGLRDVLRALLGAMSVSLAACANGPGAGATAQADGTRAAAPPRAAPDDLVSPPAAETLAAFERAQRDAADLALRQGRYADAIWALDIVLALKPSDTDAARRRAAAEETARALLPERLARARAARQRGELDAAARGYLDALALAPDHAQAAEALREIERERVRRYQLGQPSRVVMARRAPLDAGAPGTDERNALEHASLLAGQGELDAAIAVLQPIAGPRKGHSTLRALLAQLYLRQGEKLSSSDRSSAIAALERSLQVDPTNAEATLKLKRLREAPTGKIPR